MLSDLSYFAEATMANVTCGSLAWARLRLNFLARSRILILIGGPVQLEVQTLYYTCHSAISYPPMLRYNWSSSLLVSYVPWIVKELQNLSQK